MRTRRLVAVSAALCLSLASCGGSSGVKVGTDWAGSEAFLLTKMNNITVVAGINPRAGHVQPLLVIPQQADDNDETSPTIHKVNDDEWVVTAPRKGTQPSRVYMVNRTNRSLDIVGSLPEGLVMLASGGRLLGLGRSSGDGPGPASVTVYNKQAWSALRSIDLRVEATLADTGNKTVCAVQVIEGATKVAVAPTDAVAPATLFRPVQSFEAQAADCSGTQPVIAAGPSTLPGGQQPTTSTPSTTNVSRTTEGGLTVIRVSAGRVDAVATSHDKAYVAVGFPQHVEFFEIDLISGRQLNKLSTDVLTSVNGLCQTNSGWLLVASDRIVRADVNSGRTMEMPIPGELLSSCDGS